MPVRAIALLCFLFSAAAAQAQVAVAVTIPENNPTLRDVAGGVVDVVDDEWDMLSPQLDPVDVAICKADAPCLQQKANERHASHLLVVGVAGLGTRDYVVSLQLYDATGKKLVDENTVQSASPTPSSDGKMLAEKLLQVPTVPKAPPPAPVAEPLPKPASTLAVTGVSLLGASAGVAVVSTVAVLFLAVDDSSANDRAAIDTGALAAGAIVSGLAVGGVACVVFDRLYPAD